MSVYSVSSVPVTTRVPCDNFQRSDEVTSNTQKIIRLITRSLNSMWRGAKAGASEAIQLVGHYFVVGMPLGVGLLFTAWVGRDIIKEIFIHVTAR